eukprot:1364844-Alexandrium_andersonii.AAC.1
MRHCAGSEGISCCRLAWFCRGTSQHPPACQAVGEPQALAVTLSSAFQANSAAPMPEKCDV